MPLSYGRVVRLTTERREEWKYRLTRLGYYLPRRPVGWLLTFAGQAYFGTWFRLRGLSMPAEVPSRERLFDLVAAAVGHRPVVLLEFGVFRGASLSYWSSVLRHPDSVLHGFDTFRGLPQSWNRACPDGHFDMGGVPPALPDPRITLHAGLIEESLKDFEPPRREALIVSIDADLYAPAASVLRRLAPFIEPGTYLYFDEFSDTANEWRAFEEFLQDTERTFELLGTAQRLEHALFRCTG